MRWRVLFKDGLAVIIDSADHPKAVDERNAVCTAIDQRIKDGAVWPASPEAVEVERLFDHIQETV